MNKLATPGGAVGLVAFAGTLLVTFGFPQIAACVTDPGVLKEVAGVVVAVSGLVAGLLPSHTAPVAPAAPTTPAA